MIRCALAIGLMIGLGPPAAAGPGSVVRVEHRDPSALPSRGPSNALVTIEVFFTPGPGDQPIRLLEQLQARHPKRVRLIYRIVKSGGQARLPNAALEAQAQGRFFEFIDAYHGELGRMKQLPDKVLVEVARKVGLDVDRVSAAIANDTYKKVLDDNDHRRRLRFREPAQPPNGLFNGRPSTKPLPEFRTVDELEADYRAAKELAEDLLDRGADRSSLADAFDAVTPRPDDIEVRAGRTDEEIGDEPITATLATPALVLRGLPSYGPLEVATTIVVMCSPTSANCTAPLRTARLVQELYGDAVRVAWAPYFDLTRDDAAELSLLADAALCAEKVGTRLEDTDDDGLQGPASPGWRWVEAVYGETRKRVVPEKLIDRIADKLRVDRPAFATCRAQLAGASIAWIEAARRSGVRTTPSTVVGGRIYGPIESLQVLQWLVDAELAPGMLGEAAPAWARHDAAR